MCKADHTRISILFFWRMLNTWQIFPIFRKLIMRIQFLAFTELACKNFDYADFKRM
jgi:hypothetical protein